MCASRFERAPMGVVESPEENEQSFEEQELEVGEEKTFSKEDLQLVKEVGGSEYDVQRSFKRTVMNLLDNGWSEDDIRGIKSKITDTMKGTPDINASIGSVNKLFDAAFSEAFTIHQEAEEYKKIDEELEEMFKGGEAEFFSPTDFLNNWFEQKRAQGVDPRFFVNAKKKVIKFLEDNFEGDYEIEKTEDNPANPEGEQISSAEIMYDFLKENELESDPMIVDRYNNIEGMSAMDIAERIIEEEFERRRSSGDISEYAVGSHETLAKSVLEIVNTKFPDEDLNMSKILKMINEKAEAENIYN